MPTDWSVARDLDEVAGTARLPVRVRAAARAGAELIRELDEELDVRTQLMACLREGRTAGPGALAEMRADYRRRLQEKIEGRERADGPDGE